MSAESELAGFIAKFAPAMQHTIRETRAAMRARFPDAVELVWDNYNFLVIGLSPTARPSDSVFSLAAQRSGLSLCFLQRAPELPDPAGILRGSGVRVRNLPLASSRDLDRVEVSDLIDAQLRLAARSLHDSTGAELVIRSVSAQQRPRR